MATKEQIEKGMLHQIYPNLYGNAFDMEEMDKRFISLLEMHQARFGVKEAMIFSTSGRTELGGNHTDHNLGMVLAASINLDTIAAVSRRSDNKILLDSQGFPPIEISLDDLSVHEEEKGSTASLIRGIASRFSQLGYKVTGWQANVTSKVLQGSGLSSSAAIEVLIATIINHLDAASALSPVELSQISQYAENNYFGKPCGLLDQLACAHGGIVAIDFKDQEHPLIEPVTMDFRELGYDLVVTDTKADHAGLNDCYADIPGEMKHVAACFGKKVLREVDPKQFFSTLNQTRKKVGNDRAVLRAIHFFQENERVKAMVNALKQKDMATYLKLVNESGESSFCFLQNAYVPGKTISQPLSLAIALSKKYLAGQGAVRLHGGGFAGTIQAYVPKEMTKGYLKTMGELFGEGCTTLISIRPMQTTAIG